MQNDLQRHETVHSILLWVMPADILEARDLIKYQFKGWEEMIS